jgi:hypothetical protein
MVKAIDHMAGRGGTPPRYHGEAMFHLCMKLYSDYICSSSSVFPLIDLQTAEFRQSPPAGDQWISRLISTRL